MNTQYFSFFGSVKSALADSAAARALAAVEIPPAEDQADRRNEADYWLGEVYSVRLQSFLDQRGELMAVRLRPFLDRRIELPAEGACSYQEGRDGIETVTWQYGDGSAILVVASATGGWAEVGAIVWPIQFTAPAALAGACCAPRYGVEAAHAE